MTNSHSPCSADIVERLRGRDPIDWRVLKEAADEIEHLRLEHRHACQEISVALASKCPECGWSGGGVRDEGCMIAPCPRMPTVAQRCVESRENIAKAIAYDLENGPAHGARISTSPHLDNYHIDGHVNLLALADAVLHNLAAQPPAAPVDLTDPVVVHVNMLRGTIAKPTWEQIKHLYPEHFQSSADSALLPCPFCGGEPSWTGDYETKLGNVSCENSDCFGPRTTAARYDDAALQWNTRAQPQTVSNMKPSGCDPCDYPYCGCWKSPKQNGPWLQTVTIVLPSGYKTAEELATDCGFQIVYPDELQGAGK